MTKMNNQALNEQLQGMLRSHQLPDDFTRIIEQVYYPLSDILADKQREKKNPLFVSINGAQGSGKSTLAAFLKSIMQGRHGLSAVAVSIDDFYLTLEQRKKLADEVHPLFITRGVPGTHDLPMMQKAFDNLSINQSAFIPRFDKSIDDRSRETPVQVQEPVDIILFEGWCNHSLPQTSAELETPVNQLEIDEDADGIWRKYANEQLKLYNNRVFDKADMKIMLQAPAFESVYKWRRRQEEKLAASTQAGAAGIMDENRLQRFIQHYERITRHNLGVLPAAVDILLPLDEKQMITGIRMPGHE